MIEPCWGWMKRGTTKKWALSKRVEAEKAWKKCWKELLQEQIQGWVLLKSQE
jgi:hypothetical protein